MELNKIQELARKKADDQEIKGSKEWHSLYYGFIYGYQEAIMQQKQGLKRNKIN